MTERGALITVGIVGVVVFLLLRWVLNSTKSVSLVGVRRISIAIATAEGFFVQGSRPNRNNNPGNLKEDLTGKSTGTDGPFVVYATTADGWEALDRQVQLMLNGGSR